MGWRHKYRNLTCSGFRLKSPVRVAEETKNGVEYFLGMWVVRKKGLLKAHDVEANNFECTYFYTQIHLFSH